jgi:hypothetical protein
MKKTFLIVMTVCVLSCMSPQLMAKVWEIPIKVANGEIDMGERYAYAVPLGDTVRWTCEYSFEVVFDSYAPFDARPAPGLDTPRANKAIEKSARPEALLNYAYKYTVIVALSKDLLVSLDPVIIVVPPRK